MAQFEYDKLLGNGSPSSPLVPTAPPLAGNGKVDNVVYNTFGSDVHVYCETRGVRPSPGHSSRASTFDNIRFLDGMEPLIPNAVVSSVHLGETSEQKGLYATRSYRNEILSSVLCCFGNMAHGLAYGLASPAVPELIREHRLTFSQASLFESLLTVGALFGGIAVGLLVGRLGRKGTLLLSGAPFLTGWACIALKEWYVLLYIGRVLTGIGYGLVAVVGPVYIVETVSKEVRGALTMCVTLASTSGILLQFCMGLVLETRWLAVISMAPVIIMMIGMLFMPESPRWLMSRGRYAKALSALTWLRRGTEQDVMQEYKQIAENISAVDTGAGLNCSCTRAELTAALKPISICAMIFIFQQLSGTTPIIFNAQQIFSAVGFDNTLLQTGQVPAIILAAVKMGTTVIGIFLIDRVGRRPLFISCGFVMGASCIIVGLYFKYRRQLEDDFTWLPLLALLLYETAFSMAWGGIPWLLLAEIPPIRFRGVAAATGSIATRLSSFFITQEFTDLIMAIQLSGTFWLFGAVSIVGSLFAWLFMPETNQRSLEGIEQDMSLSVHMLTDSTT